MRAEYRTLILPSVAVLILCAGVAFVSMRKGRDKPPAQQVPAPANGTPTPSPPPATEGGPVTSEPPPVAYPDKSLPVIQRMKAVDGLSKKQPPEVLASLTQLLKSRNEDEALRNNIASKLRECGDPNLVPNLTAMLWDETETPKWRNYCVQHLYQCYEDHPDPAILDTLFKAAEADEKMVRICAVWSLALIAIPQYGRQLPDKATIEKIRTVALGALKEKDADFLITTSGVQSCARLGLKEALPDIRALASSNNTKPTSLRIAAVAALGDLKDTESMSLLGKLSKEATGQLQSAAALALKRIHADKDAAPQQ